MTISSGSSQVTVAITSTAISEQKTRSERIRLIITNTSGAGGGNIFLNEAGDAVINTGIALYPGGSMQWEKQSGIPIPQGRITGIASVQGSVSVYEEVLN